ncbi:hypothetical protein ACH4F3_36300 [Streptomyces anulatus]
MRLRAFLTAALSAVAVATLSAVPAEARPAGQAAPGDVVTTTLHAAVEALPITEENRTGYERTKFRHWIDADRDGCNTRKEAILEEAVTAPEVGPGCLPHRRKLVLVL